MTASSNGTRRERLTPDEVRQIRERLAAGESQRRVARSYPVTHSTIHLIARRKSYSQIALEFDAPIGCPRGSRHWKAKLTEADVVAMRAEMAAGMTTARAALKYGVSAGLVGNIRTRHVWKHVPPSAPDATSPVRTGG